MRVLNRDTFTGITALSPDAVMGQLRACTAGGREKPAAEPLFTGKLPYGGRTFDIQPICHGRNSWLPFLKGEVRETAEGSVVTVRARCWWFTRIFMLVWFGTLAFMTDNLLAQCLRYGFPRSLTAMLTTLPFWAFSFLLSHFAFWFPENEARAALCRIWQGELTEP